MESVLPATGFLYWVGAGTVAYLALRIWCLLFTAVRVWGLRNESGVGPRLGEWAGDSGPGAWPSRPQLSSLVSEAPASCVPACPPRHRLVCLDL
ncbi:hypothetical protein FD755_017183 [Muntiacus reevesi]|uniref:Uncharacterized protein n=1 Tax=Muntiacus reevesi TaxID=9886 RepID=A0A5N3X9V5_MUNRE|nr:hypothetical protein FD755_017183 [Muntiacus reevesi]